MDEQEHSASPETPGSGETAPAAAGPLQAPAQLRLLDPVPGTAGTLVPLPRTAQVLPGGQVTARAVTPPAVRVRVRPGQVRVRIRVPANARLRVIPGGAGPRPLRVIPGGAGPGPLLVISGPRQAALVRAAPARLRIVSRNGAPVPAQLVIPAGLPGQARLRIQVPARARIQVPARGRVTRALPAPPHW